MVKRSTWIVLGISALVVGAYLFDPDDHPIKPAVPTPTATGNTYLVTQAEGVLQSLRIYDKKGNAFQNAKGSEQNMGDYCTDFQRSRPGLGRALPKHRLVH